MHRRLLTLALGAVTALTVVPSIQPVFAQGRYQAQGAAQRHFDNGEAALNRGERLRADGEKGEANAAFGKAVKAFERAVDTDPAYVDAYARIGRLYYDLEQPEQAIPILRSGRARNPDSAAIRFWLGQCLLQAAQRADAGAASERESEAVALLEEVADADDSFPEAHLALANHAYDGGRFSAASERYERFLGLRPDEVQIRARLGNAYVKQQRFADALRTFEQVREVEPDNVPLLVNIGTAHLRLGQAEQASGVLERAVELDPGRATARFNLAYSYFARGRHDESLPHYRQFVAASPKSFNGRYFGGSALMAAGRDDAALPELAEAHALRPDVAQPLYKIGIIHLRNGRTDEAIAHLDKARALRPEDPWILSALGSAARQQARIEQALELHQQAVAKGPTFAKLHANLALSAVYAGDFEQADKALAEALERGAKDPWVKAVALTVLTRTARHLARQGDVDGAAQRVDRAARLAPSEAAIRANQAIVHAARGDGEAAMRAAEAAQAVGGDGAPIVVWRARARALMASGDYDTAAQAYADLSERYPAAAAAGRGAALLAADQVDAAVAELDAAAKAHPDDETIKRNRALAHLRKASQVLDRGVEAASHVRVALGAEKLLEPVDQARLRYAALIIALRRTNARDAIGHLDALQRDLRKAELKAVVGGKTPRQQLAVLVAQTQLLSDQPERAMKTLEPLRAARRGTTEAGRLLRGAHLSLGRAALRGGKTRDARIHLDAARGLGDGPFVTHDLAVLDWTQGKRARQEKVWRQLLKRVNTARFNLAVALEANGRHREAWALFRDHAEAGGPGADKAREIADAKRRVFGFAP